MSKKLTILAAARTLGSFTVADLALRSGAPAPTVQTVLNRTPEEWMVKSHLRRGTRGGQPISYELTELGRSGVDQLLESVSVLPRLAPEQPLSDKPLGLTAAQDILANLAKARPESIAGMLKDAITNLQWAEAEVREGAYQEQSEQLLAQVNALQTAVSLVKAVPASTATAAVQHASAPYYTLNAHSFTEMAHDAHWARALTPPGSFLDWNALLAKDLDTPRLGRRVGREIAYLPSILRYEHKSNPSLLWPDGHSPEATMSHLAVADVSQSIFRVVISFLADDAESGQLAMFAKGLLAGALKEQVASLDLEVRPLDGKPLNTDGRPTRIANRYLKQSREKQLASTVRSVVEKNANFWLCVNSEEDPRGVARALGRVFDANTSFCTAVVLDHGYSAMVAEFALRHHLRYEPNAGNLDRLDWVENAIHQVRVGRTEQGFEGCADAS